MNQKKLIIEIDGDLEEEFLSMSYILKVENGTSDTLSIPLYEMQSQENQLFEILNCSGISFIKRIFIMNYTDDKEKKKYLNQHHNQLVSSSKKITPLLIENKGNITISNLKKSTEFIPPGFTIYTENFPATPDEIIDVLCKILIDLNIPFEVK